MLVSLPSRRTDHVMSIVMRLNRYVALEIDHGRHEPTSGRASRMQETGFGVAAWVRHAASTLWLCKVLSDLGGFNMGW